MAYPGKTVGRSDAPRTHLAPPIPFGPVAIALVLAGSCTGGDGGGERRSGSSIICNPPGDSVIVTAVREYLQGLSPKPRRFLIAFGSDSALPAVGHQVLQSRGPTYLYPPDPAKQAELRKKLSSEFGDIRTLLVLYGGLERPDDARAVVRLGGQLIGGPDDGQRTPSRAMLFSCETAQWKYARAEEERIL